VFVDDEKLIIVVGILDGIRGLSGAGTQFLEVLAVGKEAKEGLFCDELLELFHHVGDSRRKVDFVQFINDEDGS